MNLVRFFLIYLISRYFFSLKSVLFFIGRWDLKHQRTLSVCKSTGNSQKLAAFISLKLPWLFIEARIDHKMNMNVFSHQRGPKKCVGVFFWACLGFWGLLCFTKESSFSFSLQKPQRDVFLPLSYWNSSNQTLIKGRGARRLSAWVAEAAAWGNLIWI